MDTAGKAVLFSGVTVLISLSAVMLVPSPAFRSMALGIMVAVVFILAATLTLLPAVLGALGSKVDNLSLPWVHSGEHRSPRFAALGRAHLGATPSSTASPRCSCCSPSPPPCSASRPACRRSRSSRPATARASATRRCRPRSAPARPARSSSSAPARDAAALAATAKARPGHRRRDADPDLERPARYALVQAIPRQNPSDPAVGRTDRPPPRHAARRRARRRRSRREPRPRDALAHATPLVIGVVLTLGFLLLLDRAAGAHHRARRRPRQPARHRRRLRRRPAHLPGRTPLLGLLGFESQGFLDAWGPVFFFAMIFAISMDYTVFLLASAKEHLEHSGGDARDAMIGGVAHSGRVILAAAAVMVAVFFTFALSGPLPPKEMGIILGVAVALDALLVRLAARARRATPARPLGLVAPTPARPPAAQRHLRARPRLTPVYGTATRAQAAGRDRRVRRHDPALDPTAHGAALGDLPQPLHPSGGSDESR